MSSEEIQYQQAQPVKGNQTDASRWILFRFESNERTSPVKAALQIQQESERENKTPRSQHMQRKGWERNGTRQLCMRSFWFAPQQIGRCGEGVKSITPRTTGNGAK
jgi:hypothetical protein